jgi:hypothetical protein
MTEQSQTEDKPRPTSEELLSAVRTAVSAAIRGHKQRGEAISVDLGDGVEIVEARHIPFAWTGHDIPGHVLDSMSAVAQTVFLRLLDEEPEFRSLVERISVERREIAS